MSNHANPPPPAGHRSGSASTSSGLQQDDFRKLLATPRAVTQKTPRVPSTPKPRVAATPGGKDADGFARPMPTKAKKPFKPKKEKDEDELEESASLYRDRAKERREGANPDYLETDEMLAVLKTSETEKGSAIGPVKEFSQSTVSYEQSKYLGGDMQHTHLVKGLDFALLDRVKKQLKEEVDVGQEEEIAKSYIDRVHGAGPTKFNSTFAANICDIAIKKAKPTYPPRNELFIPGRLIFSYDLGSRIGDTDQYSITTDIPTSIVRSKAESRNSDGAMGDTTGDLVIEKIISVVSALREAAEPATLEKKRIKRKDKIKQQAKAAAAIKTPIAPAPEESTAMVVEDDGDDIFADAGRDYKLDVSERQERSGKLPALPAGFLEVPNDEAQLKDAISDSGTEADRFLSNLIKEGAGMLDQLQGTGAAKKLVGSLETESDKPSAEDVAESSLNAAAEVKKRRREVALLPEPVVQAAAEVSYGVDLADLDDSASDSEEPDLNQMDMGVRQNKQRQLTRFSFDTEEEWHKYKESQVHMPKAAFQFGVKSADGRKKAGGKADKPKSKDQKQKMNREFQQLNKVYSNKYGQALEEEGSKKKKQKK
ncbi:RED-like protein N-terminal region-domain-containing protein [Phlyctochytrium arcticum]|nr:RED-like protein N-terminal region-domain-containing protein [Phlyctochytrium arcticum]